MFDGWWSCSSNLYCIACNWIECRNIVIVRLAGVLFEILFYEKKHFSFINDIYIGRSVC